jgi:hypothetical protein
MYGLMTLSGLVFIVPASYTSKATADCGSLLKDMTTIGIELLTSQIKSLNTASLDNDTLISGLKQALGIGTQNAIGRVGKTDGYLADKLVHIPLPPACNKISSLMCQIGLPEKADQSEHSINRAAEKAAPEAREVLLSAIQNTSIDDGPKVSNGSGNAAPQYFKTKNSAQLTALLRSKIESTLNDVEPNQHYSNVSQQIVAVPLVGEIVNLDLPSYVAQ